MLKHIESARMFAVRNLFLYSWLPLTYLLVAALSVIGSIHLSIWWSIPVIVATVLGVPAYYMQYVEPGRFVRWNPRAYPVLEAFHEATSNWEMYAGIACIAGFAHLAFAHHPLWAIGSVAVFLFCALLLCMDVYNNIRAERAEQARPRSSINFIL